MRWSSAARGCDDPYSRDGTVHPDGCLCGDARWAAENYQSEPWNAYRSEIAEQLDAHGVTDRRLRREVTESLLDSWRIARAEERGEWGPI